MSTFYAVSTVKHGGKRFFRGDELTIQREEDAKALLATGAISKEPVVDEKDEGSSRLQSDEEKKAARADKEQGQPETQDGPADGPGQDGDTEEGGEGDQTPDPTEGLVDYTIKEGDLEKIPEDVRAKLVEQGHGVGSTIKIDPNHELLNKTENTAENKDKKGIFGLGGKK